MFLFEVLQFNRNCYSLGRCSGSVPGNALTLLREDLLFTKPLPRSLQTKVHLVGRLALEAKTKLFLSWLKWGQAFAQFSN